MANKQFTRAAPVLRQDYRDNEGNPLPIPEARSDARIRTAAKKASSLAPMRPVDSKPGGNSDAKAIEYAEFLIRRDGSDLAAMATELDGLKYLEKAVEWDHCRDGRRPRFVLFLIHRPAKKARVIAKIELPHWDFEAADAVEELSE